MNGAGIGMRKTNKAKLALLNLNLQRRYFAEIATKEKRIEYRDRTPYWKVRLENRRYDAIVFRNGYSKDAPEMLVEFNGLRKYGTARNGYYAIRLGDVLRIRRWKNG